jgi:hypothetical protein
MASKNSFFASAAGMKITILIALFFSAFNPLLASDELTDNDLAWQVEAIYKQGMPKAPSDKDVPIYSATSLMKIVNRRWDNLDQDIQKRLVQYINEPVTTGPGAPDGQQSIETEHFQIFYMIAGESKVPSKDSDSNGIPDYAQNVGTYLETSWDTLVEKNGFKAPPALNRKIICHLKKINHNGLTHAKTNVIAWMEFHSDIAAFTKSNLGAIAAAKVTIDPEGLEAGLLKACCAHEFFHCIQAAYDWDEENWWCEATAEWAGNAVFPESKFYTNNVVERFANPHVSLFSKEGWYEYAASIWAMFLSENYGGVEPIRAIWEASVGSTTIQEATDTVLGDMREPFLFFACYNYLREYADGTRFPAMKELELQKAGSISSVGINAAQLYGANYFSFSPATSGIKTINVELSDKTDDADIRLITISGSNWNIMPNKLSSGKTVINLEEDNLPDKIIVVVCSFSNKSELDYTITLK